jgi:hypothetical protein
MRRFLVAILAIVAATSARAQNVVCESLGNAYRECRAGSSGKVQMVMELSERLCFEGISWGTRSDGIVWVSRGCRAVFTTGAGFDPTQRGDFPLVCESQHNKREVCPAKTTHPIFVGRLLSKNPCIEGETWGYDPVREQIWVDAGCRAEFVLASPTSPFPTDLNAIVSCKSDDGRRRDCAADTSHGVQVDHHTSEGPCRFRREWGWDSKGVWVSKGCGADFATRGKPLVHAIRCESENDRRAECEADTIFGVALIRQLSERACIFGETWGFDNAAVWVTNGCRGQFVLGGYRLPPDAVPPTAARVACESLDGTLQECRVDTTRGIGLIRELSKNPCVLNRTWGYRADAIWVTDGCRAEFAVAR